MSKASKLPVEALSAPRWARIERALFARQNWELAASDAAPASRRAWRLQPALAVLAVAATLAVLASVIVRGSFEDALDPPQNPSRLTTGNAASHLVLSGLSLDVKPESEVVVGPETSQGRLIVIDRGSLTCEVAPRAPGAPLIVQAGGARVRVVGTRFTVSRSGESVQVEVAHGVVEVSAGGQSFRVAAGQAWPPFTTASARERSVAAVAQPVSAPSAPTNRPGPDLRNKAAPPRLRSVPPPASATHQTLAAATVPSSQNIFETAAQLEAREPARAAALYQSLERGPDAWAQNALYAHGRLEAARGNALLARRLLTQYLAAFPHGTNADDARAVLERLK